MHNWMARGKIMEREPEKVSKIILRVKLRKLQKNKHDKMRKQKSNGWLMR